MKAFKWILAAASLAAAQAAFAAQTNGVIVSHFEPLQKLSFESRGIAAYQKLGGAGPMTLRFDALSTAFELELEPNSKLLSSAARSALPEGIGIYRGRLAGKADSWARIVVFAGQPRGLVFDGSELFAIEAPGDSALPISAPVIYRLADTYIVPGSMSCGTEIKSGNGQATYDKLVGEIGTALAQGPGAVENLDLGAIGDFEFTSAQGGDAAAAAAITTRLNNTDGIYSQQLGVQLSVQTLETYSTASDPFTDTTDAPSLLDELGMYRQATPSQNTQGLTHLYTGKNLDTSTVGIAYTGALCMTRYGAGLSEGRYGPTTDSLIAAHEIGHNFSAPHDGETGSACEAEPQTFIMAPSVNGSATFSNCSINEMADDIAVAPCITPLPAVDMSVALNGPSPMTVLLGNDAVLNFDLDNNGTLQATNVEVDITVPGNVSFVSANASAGSCSFGAGIVNCQIGTVPGVTSRTVTITAATATVGNGNFDAIVTADVDERPTNNLESVQLTVDPAVDLVIIPPANPQIQLDQSTTINATLENRATMDATGVTLSISLNNGLRADAASWSLGSCNVTATQVDCQTANFANQSNATMSLTVTGVTAGNRSYTVSLASNEAEAKPNDNSFNGTVTVNDPNAPSNSSGGGGATGPLFLWPIAGALLLRRRRRQPQGGKSWRKR